MGVSPAYDGALRRFTRPCGEVLHVDAGRRHYARDPDQELVLPTIGVDLGGTYVHVLVLDEDDQIIGRSRMKTPTTGDRGAVLEVMEAAVHDALGDGGLGRGDAQAIGVGTPGVVIDGSVGGASNVPGWYDRFELSTHFANQMGMPVRVANDANAAAMGEYHLGAGRGYEDVLVIYVGTGVGAGLVLGGELFEGRFGGAGEFGHTCVDRGGAVCPCGRRGCVEAYAGRRAMAQKAERLVAGGRETILFDVMQEQDETRPSSAVFKAAFERGDDLVADLLDDAVEALGAGIGSVVNLLDVELVVIGGVLADDLGPLFVARVEAASRPYLFLQPPHVDFATTGLAGEAGALGAALLAREVEG